MHPMLIITVYAVRKAGNVVARHYETPDSVKTSQKGSNDFTTNVDRAAEAIIIKTIYKSCPQHAIITGESGEHVDEDLDAQWVVNPLGSTTNLVRRLPHLTVSIAVCTKGRTEITVAYDLICNKLLTATRSQGVQLNDYRLYGSTVRDLDGTTTATDFPFKTKRHAASYTKTPGSMFTECMDFRRTGSAMLDLAYVVAACVDGYLKIGLRPWDFAAGELIAREAGALICDFTDGHNYAVIGNVVAGNPRVVKAMLANTHNGLSDALKR